MRNRVLFLWVVLCGLALSVKAQNIAEVSAEQVGRTIEISYVLDLRSDVTIYYSLNRGITFSGPMSHVYGDVGENVAPGKKLIVWQVSEDMESLETKDLCFKLVAVENQSMKNKGLLRFDVFPETAKLYVNGNVVPAKEPMLVCANTVCHVEAYADGYLPYARKVRLEEGEELEMKIHLEDHRDITVKTNVPATYTIGKESAHNVDSAVFSLELGQHELFVEVGGYEPLSKVLNVTDRSKTEYEFRLRPEAPNRQFVMLDYQQVFKHGAPLFGFRYGQVRKLGWYVAADASILGNHYGSDYKADDSGNGQAINGVVPFYDGHVSRNAFSVKGGMLARMGCPLYLYFGAGVAYQSTTATMTDGQWVQLGSEWSTRTAFEYEVGLMADIKNFVLRAGFGQYVGNGTKPVLGVGVGYMFDKK